MMGIMGKVIEALKELNQKMKTEEGNVIYIAIRAIGMKGKITKPCETSVQVTRELSDPTSA